MKKLLAAGAFALMAMAGSAQAATTVSFNGGSGTLPTNTTVIQDFGPATAAPVMIGTNAYATGMSSSLAFRPTYGSTGNFAAVLDGGSYSIAFNPTSLFSFVLGSLDTFNVLTLRYTDGTSMTYTGGQITNDASFNSGSRTDMDTNGVVSYNVTSGAFINGATFASSGGNSFEFDNISAAVPEPAMWGMMILGFGVIGGVLRRRPSAKLRLA